MHNDRPVDFNKVIEERIGQLVLSKKLRHDAVYMCGLVVSSDTAFFQRLGDKETERFFQAAYDYLADFVGRENVISATVHLDEKTPHMHFMHVPVTKDGRLAANSIYDKKAQVLTHLHDGLSAYLKQHRFSIERGGSGQGKAHLNTKDFKEQREALKALNAQAEAKQLELVATRTELDRTVALLREMADQAREAEAILQQEPEPPKPTLLNYKAVCDSLAQRLELLKRALANQQAIGDRNRKLEAGHKTISSELKVLKLKTDLDAMESRQAAEKARHALQRAEDEKRALRTALAEANDFISQPEVRAMYEKYTARKQDPAQGRAQEALPAPPHASKHGEHSPGFTLAR